MKIDEKTFKALPADLQVMFCKCPNPGSEEVVALFPNSKSTGGDGSGFGKNPAMFQASGRAVIRDNNGSGLGYGDTGSAARFFYCAKASKWDRDEGCEEMDERKVATMNTYLQNSEGRTADKNGGPKRNYHPTVKPTNLMRYLCRLVTPPNGLVLDPFAGSGSTGKGAVLEGFRFIGIEREGEYVKIAKARIAKAVEDRKQQDSQLSLF